MFHKTVLTAALLLPALGLHAQKGIGKPEDIKLVRSLPLVVVMEKENPRKVKKLTKRSPEELASYRKAVATRNESLKTQVQKYWKLSPDLQFKTSGEIDSLVKNTPQIYSTLRLFDYLDVKQHRGIGADGLVSNESQDITMSANTRCTLRLQLRGKGRSENQSVGWANIDHTRIHESDISFSVREIQDYLDNCSKGQKTPDMTAESKANASRLKEKTLLLDEEDARENLSLADISACYPYPVKLVERSVIEEAVQSADARYACVRLVPTSSSGAVYMVAHLVMSTDTGDILAYSTPFLKPILLIGKNANSGFEVGKATLSDFARCAAGK